MHRRRQRSPEEEHYDICRRSPETNEIVTRHKYSYKGLVYAEIKAKQLNEELSEKERIESPWEPYTPAKYLPHQDQKPNGKYGWRK